MTQIPSGAIVTTSDGRELIDRKKLPEDRRHGLARPLATSLLSVMKLDDLTRFQFGVTLLPLHMYEIGSGRNKTVAPNGSGYDAINRYAGVQFVMPQTVHDQAGEPFRNPIHRRDYLYLSLIGVYRNDVGQLTSYREDIEVDFQRLYDEARLNAEWSDGQTWTNKADKSVVVTERPRGSRDKIDDEWIWSRGNVTKAIDLIEYLRDDQTGKPLQDDDGMPIAKLVLPDHAEAKAHQRMFDLRRFGLRYAYTVAKNRIMASATGIKKLPLNEVGECVVSIASWRDLMTPEDRAQEAARASRGVWGTPIGTNVAGLDEQTMGNIDEDVMAGEYREEPADLAHVPTPDEIAEIEAREASESQ